MPMPHPPKWPGSSLSDIADDDNASIYSRFSNPDLSLSGLRDLVLRVNTQTQALLTNMSVSLQNISSDVMSLREQLRKPTLKKKKSDEREKTTAEFHQGQDMEPSSAGALFGNPNGNSRTKVYLSTVKQAQVLDVERRSDTAEKLARALLSLLFTHEEISQGNCTKPTRGDIVQLDSERLWAIKCHIDYLYPVEVEGEDRERAVNNRWKDIQQKCLNPICRHFRHKKE